MHQIATDPDAAFVMALTVGGIAAAVATLIIQHAFAQRRQRAYRDAITRRDWAEAHRLMGCEEGAP